MPLSVLQDRSSPEWPLGFVQVANNGTPVCIMTNVDPNNNNAPGTRTGSNTAEYTPLCHHIAIQGYHPGNNNNGMVINSGNVYLLRAPAGNGSGNRSDSGAMVKVVFGGADYVIPESEQILAGISPYRYYLDADVDGEGALVTLYGTNP